MSPFYTKLYDLTTHSYCSTVKILTNQNVKTLIIQLEFVVRWYNIEQVVEAYPLSIYLSLLWYMTAWNLHYEYHLAVYTIYNIQGVPKKSLWFGLEEKCLRNSKIFFNGVFLYLTNWEEEIYRYRKTPSKYILEFLKHFFPRSIHKLFSGTPCTYIYIEYTLPYIQLCPKYIYNHFPQLWYNS